MLQTDAEDEGGILNFRSRLLEIDGDFHSDDISTLKFLCRDLTSATRLQKIKEGHDFFHMLEKMGVLSDKNPWLLAELLMRLQRLDLLDTLGVDEDVLEQYIQKHGSYLSPYRLMLLEVGEDLCSEEVDKMVYLLEISKSKREKVKSPLNLLSYLEQAKVIGQNNVEKLIEMLLQLGRNDLVEIIDKYKGSITDSQAHGGQSGSSQPDKMDVSEYSEGASYNPWHQASAVPSKKKGVQVEYPPSHTVVQSTVRQVPRTHFPQRTEPESSLGGLPIQEMVPEAMIYDIARHIQQQHFVIFGFQLDIQIASLHQLSQRYPNLLQRSFEMVKFWLHSSKTDSRTTIRKLVLALKQSGLKDLSDNLCRLYGISVEDSKDTAITSPVEQMAAEPEHPNISVNAAEAQYTGDRTHKAAAGEARYTGDRRHQAAAGRDEVPVDQMSRVNIEEIVPYYKMDAKPRGICVIFNNKSFHKVPNDPHSREMPQREGTDIDAVNLQNVFKELHFIIERYDNLTDTEMVRKLVDIALNRDHSRYDCFVCCILSHGTQGYIYGSNGRLINITDLTGQFKSVQCPSLAGKPKLFFFQACQGREKQTGHEMEEDSSAGTSLQTDAPREVIPNEADFLLGYATVPGFVSYRSRTQGSWYITKLVEMLHKYGKREDILSILLLVNNEVGQANALMEGGRYKQSPAPLYTLRKKVLFQ